MISISGKPLAPDAFEGQYPTESFEQSLLQTLSDNNFSYDSMEQLQFELELRKATVNAAKELNQSDMDFAIFRKSRCNHDYWIRTDEGGFLLKDSVKSSAAIRDIYEHGGDYATECATATVIVYLRAVLDVYPATLFDLSFNKIYLMNWHSVNPPLSGIGLLNDVKVFLPGDRMYFINPDVNPETPEWQGENTVFMGADMFYGPGLGTHNEGTMIKMLNKHRVDNADESAYLLKQVGRPDYNNLLKIRQAYHP
jgi:protein-glutamine gamma-glutamyltransferase